MGKNEQGTTLPVGVISKVVFNASHLYLVLKTS